MKIKTKYDIGEYVKCKVTDFKGVVMAITLYDTGCLHYALLSKKIAGNGKPSDWHWLDETRLISLNKKIFIFGESTATGGPQPNAPSN